MKTFYAEVSVKYTDSITEPGEDFRDVEDYVEIFTAKNLKEAKRQVKKKVMDEFTDAMNPDGALTDVSLIITDIYETTSDARI